jgi:3-methyladenine DNA glycosylase AlkD
MFSSWDDVDGLSDLIYNWQHWDELTFKWEDIVSMGRKLGNVYEQADGLFKEN